MKGISTAAALLAGFGILAVGPQRRSMRSTTRRM
jgi:hypothetical protein